jgi:hypothetical protein
MDSTRTVTKFTAEFAAERHRVVMAAVDAGKIVDYQKWARHYDADPEGTTQTLASLASASVAPHTTASVPTETPAYDPAWLTPAERARIGGYSHGGRIIVD